MNVVIADCFENAFMQKPPGEQCSPGGRSVYRYITISIYSGITISLYDYVTMPLYRYTTI